MYFKKLIGKKCYLSPIDVNDVEIFTEWLNDLEVMKYFNLYHHMISLENEKETLIKLSNDHNYSIIDLEKNELIGNCGYCSIDHINQTAETGIFIGNKSFWNKGYGIEALSLLIDYGFKALNFHNIMLRVFENNKGAIKCYEKIGFKHIGVRREVIQRDLQKQNAIYMDILKNDFYKE
jgi:RimJ/RimL family protein N-acetyltransferase